MGKFDFVFNLREPMGQSQVILAFYIDENVIVKVNVEDKCSSYNFEADAIVVAREMRADECTPAASWL